MADVVDCLHPPSPRFLKMPDIFSGHSSLIFNCLHPQSNSTLESVSPLLELPGTIDCISSLGCGIDDGSRLPISSLGRICSWRSTHHQGSEILRFCKQPKNGLRIVVLTSGLAQTLTLVDVVVETVSCTRSNYI